MTDFFRKGVVGDWKTHFDEETNDRWNKWIAKNLDDGTDVNFTFE
jgi:hypothetical protein